MSTMISTENPAPRSINSHNRVKRPSFRENPRQSYSMWREPVSQRQINTYFEQHILPELSALLESAFVDIPEFEREDAVQDATCQALEVFRVLRLYEISRKNTTFISIAVTLADFTSHRYLAGVRFAAPRSASSL